MKAFLAVLIVLVCSLVVVACPPPPAPGYEGPQCGDGPAPMPDSCPMPKSCEGERGWVQPDDYDSPTYSEDVVIADEIC